MSDYKLGDKVICTVTFSPVRKGMTGEIIDFPRKDDSSTANVGIKWKDFNNGHRCNGKCRRGKGYYLPLTHIKSINWRERFGE